MNQVNQSETYDVFPEYTYTVCCHKCKNRLLMQTKVLGIKYYKCPKDHSEIKMLGNLIVGYSILWMSNNNEEYILIGTQDRTTLYKRIGVVWEANASYKIPLQLQAQDKSIWHKVLNTDHIIELDIQNNMILVDNLIPRLLNLKAFT